MSINQENICHISGDPGNYYSQSNEKERKYFREWVQGLLKDSEVTIDFIKSNGEFRSMKCTLSEQHGAKYTMNENKDRPARKPNLEVCVVWDCNQNAWRSFRWDRVKRIQFEIG